MLPLAATPTRQRGGKISLTTDREALGLHFVHMADPDHILNHFVCDDDIELVRDLLSSDSDEEEPPKRGGSRAGKAANVERGREAAEQRLHQQYFASNPIYSSTLFRRRFRLSERVYSRVASALVSHYKFFRQLSDCTQRKGFSCNQKITAALRMLSYGICADALDETLAMSETTVLLCLENFCAGVYNCFHEEYLRTPTDSDLKNILRRSSEQGFPGMLGSIDCCKWEWKNCPVGWHGQYEGKEGSPTVTLEAIADSTLWIWHAFFGMPGSCNDINVVEASPLVTKISTGAFPPPLVYTIHNQTRHIPYFLADGIYPKWPIFVHTVSYPVNEKEKCLAKWQEARRKDVERAFGVLQSRWHIIARPARFWSSSKMATVIRACIILHNMMVEDRLLMEAEEESIEPSYSFEDLPLQTGSAARPMWASFSPSGLPVVAAPPGSLAAMCEVRALLENVDEYHKTRSLVMAHLWERQGTMSL